MAWMCHGKKESEHDEKLLEKAVSKLSELIDSLSQILQNMSAVEESQKGLELIGVLRAAFGLGLLVGTHGAQQWWVQVEKA